MHVDKTQPQHQRDLTYRQPVPKRLISTATTTAHSHKFLAVPGTSDVPFSPASHPHPHRNRLPASQPLVVTSTLPYGSDAKRQFIQALVDPYRLLPDGLISDGSSSI